MNSIATKRTSKEPGRITSNFASSHQKTAILLIRSCIGSIVLILITAYFRPEFIFFLLVPICSLGICHLIEFPYLK
ncbi:hypothetical protein DLD82_02015 [Methanospirillum stamsii]|uniref:Uncharacterized protein n=1 Tax=Methanospirillum stamsii TaxID=1277351 RepID=A0A2V2NKJ7_9EURY|nr:hypothetical protein DLD82_02015 [Methanospirillum stamsii]